MNQSDTETGPGAGDTPGGAVPLDAPTLIVLVMAVLAISSSAVLVRWADAPAVALAFWRTLGGAAILLASSSRVGSLQARTPRSTPTAADWRLMVVAGLALAVHFGAWLASLELTSVAASVTLVSTAPVMIAGWSLVRGLSPSTNTWWAIGLAVAGTVIITLGPSMLGTDSSSTVDRTNPVLGNALALVGAAAMAVYLMAGAAVRRRLSTSVYASRTYAVAAGALLVVSLLFGVELVRFDLGTWLVIGAMIAGPQLAGHTGLNHLLERLGSITVSLVLLAEPVAASVLAWLLLGEVPPAAALLGAPLVIAAVALRLRTQDIQPAGG